MKAGVVVRNEVVEYKDVPKPVVRENTVLVKVKCCGICGSDVPRVLNNGVHFYPIVLGHEFSGVVEEVGPGAEEFQKGDRVAGVPLVPCFQCDDCKKGHYSLCKHYTFIGSRVDGAFSEYVLLPKTNAVKIGDRVTFEQGAFFEPSTVALHGITLTGFVPGQTVAVFGGGTIGIFAAQWASILGGKDVTVFDISEERLALARKFGFHAVNSGEENYLSKTNGYTGGKGFDLCLETCGREETIKACMQACANKGEVCLIGTPTGPVSFSVKEWETINRKEMRMVGSWMSYSDDFPGKEWRMTSEHFADGSLRIADEFIYKKFPLSRIQEAFDLFRDRGKVKGKVMIEVGEEK